MMIANNNEMLQITTKTTRGEYSNLEKFRRNALSRKISRKKTTNKNEIFNSLFAENFLNKSAGNTISKYGSVQTK